MFLSILIVSIYYYLNRVDIYDYSLIIPLLLLLIVGLYDDVYRMDFKLKFIFQIIAAKIIIDNGFIIDNLHGVLWIYEMNRVFAQLFTVFIIVAIINSINFIDGIDGLAISIVTLFIILFELLSTLDSKFLYLSVILVSSLIPLYYFNFKEKNKIFLGDSGSLFLGGIVSIYVIHILSQEYIIKDIFDIHKILFVFSILVYPIIDIIRIVTLRLYRKRSPFVADKNHIHHILLNKLNNHSFVVSIIILICIIIFITVHSVF